MRRAKSRNRRMQGSEERSMQWPVLRDPYRHARSSCCYRRGDDVSRPFLPSFIALSDRPLIYFSLLPRGCEYQTPSETPVYVKRGAGMLKRAHERVEVLSHAAASLEPETRASIRAHKGR